MPDQSRSFAEASAVTAAGGGVFSAEIRPGWDIVGNAHGGYMLAVAARAAGLAAGRPVPVSATAHFLGPGTPGPVSIGAEVIKAGRRYSTVSVSMSADRPLLAMVGAFADRAGEAGVFERMEAGPPELPPPEDCIAVEPTDTFPPPFMGRVELRLHPGNSEIGAGSEARVSGWVRLRGGGAIDEVALLMLADSFPPAVFFVGAPVAWVPTLELTVHVRERPAPGWLRGIFTTRFVTSGMLEEDGELWDERGRLVAQSRQLALVPR